MDQILKLLNARVARAGPSYSVLERMQMFPLTGRHRKVFRLRGGILFWLETWCNNQSVLKQAVEEAELASSYGFRVMFLPRRFSVRDAINRRPCLITPVESKVNLDEIFQILMNSDYQGPLSETET